VFTTTLQESHQEELVSLSVYNDESETVLSLTDQYYLLFGPLDDISNQFDEGGTNIGGGMLRGLASLADASVARQDATKVMVLLTDGVHNFGHDPIQAARSLAEQGVTVFTITFSDEARQADMQQVAAICGGRHFHATTGTGLKQAFTDIAKYLPNLLTK
jgi:Mg-chelatase subunit ChlD